MADVRLEGSADIATANTNQDVLDRSSAQVCLALTTMGYIDTIIANNRNAYSVTGIIYFQPLGDAAANGYRMDFAIPAKGCVSLLPKDAKLWVKPTDKLTVQASATSVNVMVTGVGE